MCGVVAGGDGPAQIAIMLAYEAALAKRRLETFSANRQKARHARGTRRPHGGFEARVEKSIGSFGRVSDHTAQMRRLAFGQEVRPATYRTVGVDRDESGQTPGDARLLDLAPRRRRIPRQLANPVLLFAGVEHLCV